MRRTVYSIPNSVRFLLVFIACMVFVQFMMLRELRSPWMWVESIRNLPGDPANSIADLIVVVVGWGFLLTMMVPLLRGAVFPRRVQGHLDSYTIEENSKGKRFIRVKFTTQSVTIGYSQRIADTLEDLLDTHSRVELLLGVSFLGGPRFVNRIEVVD